MPVKVTVKPTPIKSKTIKSKTIKSKTIKSKTRKPTTEKSKTEKSKTEKSKTVSTRKVSVRKPRKITGGPYFSNMGSAVANRMNSMGKSAYNTVKCEQAKRQGVLQYIRQYCDPM